MLRKLGKTPSKKFAMKISVAESRYTQTMFCSSQ